MPQMYNTSHQRLLLKRLAACCVVYLLVSATPSLQQAPPNAQDHRDAAAGVAAGEQSSAIGGSGGAQALSSSVGESSAALADDLIAAESAQSSEAQVSEHKPYTSAQLARQEGPPQQVAPAAMQQQVPQAYAVHPQQQQQQQAQQQQQQQQQQQVQPQHIAMQQRLHQLAAQKPYNPFMAAALAGNYGPAQQQVAAAAAAAAGYGPARQAYGQPPHAIAAGAQQQQQHPMAAHARQVQMAQMAFEQQHPQQHLQQQHHHQQQQAASVAPQQAPHPQLVAAVAQQHHHQQPQHMAVQESSLRQNIVPAPQQVYNSNQQQQQQPPQQPSSQASDPNSIEMNDAPAVQPAASQQQTQLATASSAQHPVIAAAASNVHATAVQVDSAQSWPLQAPDIPKIVNLEVKCEKNLMKVSVEFDKVFNGVIFSKGHYNQAQCVHVGQQSGKQQAYFDISINSCGTQGNTQNGLYGMGGNTGSGTFFENTIVIQYDPNVQEVYDHARKLRCTWHDQYEKAVTFRPFPVDMLDIVRADFAGDNVGCWMQIQVGKGPWASEVAGIVKIGQTMTMVLAIKDEENKFDMLVRNCFAHDGKRGPIELVDKAGCITRPKLMSRFTKIKNFGSSATVLSYAHFQAFKFPDSMEVHFQCTIQICRHQCPEQCASGPGGAHAAIGGPGGSDTAYSESTIMGTFNINGRDGHSAQQQAGAATGNSQQAAGDGAAAAVHLRKYGASLSRARREVTVDVALNGSHHFLPHQHHHRKPLTQSVGVNKIIQVVSTGDLAFTINKQQLQQQQETPVTNGDLTNSGAEALAQRVELSQQVCMSSYNFVLALVVLTLVLVCSTLTAIMLYMRQRSYLAARSGPGGKLLVPHSSCPSPSITSSGSSTLRSNTHIADHRQQVPIEHNNMYANNKSAYVFDASKLH